MSSWKYVVICLFLRPILKVALALGVPPPDAREWRAFIGVYARDVAKIGHPFAASRRFGDDARRKLSERAVNRSHKARARGRIAVLRLLPPTIPGGGSRVDFEAGEDQKPE